MKEAIRKLMMRSMWCLFKKGRQPLISIMLERRMLERPVFERLLMFTMYVKLLKYFTNLLPFDPIAVTLSTR